MMLRTTQSALLCLGLLAGSASYAHADKEASVEIYKKGKKKYNLGDFEDAIVLFKQAYDEFEAPAYLYNIAQAYRQLDNCKKALFFYERFLAEKPGSSQEETIKGYVTTLKGECGDSGSEPGALNEVDDPMPKGPAPSSTAGNATEAASSGSASTTTSVTAGSVETGPRGPLIVATAEAGMSFYNLGEVLVPVSPTLRLGAAYPITVGKIDVEAGAAIILSSMAYDHAMGDSTMLFKNYLLNAAASYPLSEVLRVGGELGVGLFSFGELTQGNPFTDSGVQADSASTVSLRIGGSAEYAVTKEMGLSLSPAFTYAGAHDELASDISSVSIFQLVGGLRYRW